MDLDQYIVAVGQFGGAIAMTRDPRVPVQHQGTMPKPGVDIYSPSGFFETNIQWLEGSGIVALGWNHREELVVVADNGMVHLYDVRKEKTIKKFSMGQNALEAGVREAKLLPDARGLVILTNDDLFFLYGRFFPVF